MSTTSPHPPSRATTPVVPLPVPSRHSAAGPGREPRALALLPTALAAVVAASPLVGGLYDLAAWAPLGLAVWLALVAVLLAAPTRLGRPSVVALAGLGGFAAWSGASMAWTPSVERAWLETSRWGLYAGIVAVALLTVRNAAVARLVAATLAAGVGVVCVLVLARLGFDGGSDLFVDARLAGPVGYANGFAGFAVMALWLLIAWAEASGSALRRGGALALAVLAVALVVLTQSRAAFPVLAVSAAVLIAAVPGRRRRAWALLTVLSAAAFAMPWLLAVYANRVPGSPPNLDDVRAAVLASLFAALVAGAAWAVACAWAAKARDAAARVSAAGLCLVVLAAGVLALPRADDVVERARAEYRAFVSLQFDAQRTNRFSTAGGNRNELWRVALEQARAAPATGIGAGGYATAWFEERRIAEDAVRQPHSLPLQALAELGIPGAAALLAFLLAVLWAGVRPARGAVTQPDRLLQVAGLGTFVAWLTHTSVDWLHVLPGLTGVALIAAVLLLGQVQTSAAGTTMPSARARALRGLAVLLVLLVAAATGRLFAADREQRAAAKLLTADPARALVVSERALALNAASLDARYVRAAAQARLGRYEAARAALEDAARVEPRNHVAWVLLGDLAIRRGDHALAARDYAQALARNPRDLALAAALRRARERAAR